MKNRLQLTLNLWASARADGIMDGEAGNRDHADRWPPGAIGHADYELGQQDVERQRDAMAAAAANDNADQVRIPTPFRPKGTRQLRRPGKKERRAASNLLKP